MLNLCKSFTHKQLQCSNNLLYVCKFIKKTTKINTIILYIILYNDINMLKYNTFSILYLFKFNKIADKFNYFKNKNNHTKKL